MIRAFLEKVGLLSKKEAHLCVQQTPVIIPRAEHGISRKDISENALKVLYRLRKQGYEAYLVGGGVRDLLLGLHPKDFDVATNATPEQVSQVFRNCRLIGKRFRLAHVYFGYDIVEVATFRGKTEEQTQERKHSDVGVILRDNVYGTLKQDVWRRDFTMNALYYNIADFSLVDYTGGYADIKAKRLRMIGNPSDRYREDPVRMLRAVRFACKVNFSIPKELSSPMLELKNLIGHVSPARLFEEIMKMFHSGAASVVFKTLLEYGLFNEIFPATGQSLKQDVYPTHALLSNVFENTDTRIKEQKTVTPAFIIAALLWHPICLRAKSYEKEGMTAFAAQMTAVDDLLYQQTRQLSIPKRIVQGARDIWLLQMRLARRHSKRITQIMTELRFRAAYDFLLVRADSGEEIKELAKWWQDYVEGSATKRRSLLKALGTKKRKKSRRKKPSSEDEV